MTANWSLQTLIDHEQIRQLIYRYSRGADRHDEAILRSVYAAGATDNHGPFRGSAQEFVDYMMNPPAGGYTTGQHHIGNIIIEVDGDQAQAESVFVCYLISEGDDPQKPVLDVMGGRYLDRLTREDGEWRISDRTVALDWNERRRKASAIPHEDTFVAGIRGAEDLSYDLFAK
jgi:hypothetical protein